MAPSCGPLAKSSSLLRYLAPNRIQLRCGVQLIIRMNIFHMPHCSAQPVHFRAGHCVRPKTALVLMICCNIGLASPPNRRWALEASYEKSTYARTGPNALVSLAMVEGFKILACSQSTTISFLFQVLAWSTSWPSHFTTLELSSTRLQCTEAGTMRA